MVDQVEAQPHSGAFTASALFRGRLGRGMFGKPVLLASLGAIVALWGGVAATVLHQHSSAMEEDRRAGLAAAAVAVESTASMFAAAEAALAGASLRAGDRDNPDWRVLLDDAEKALPDGIAFLAAYKTNGRLIHRTQAPDGHRESIATLDHFHTPIVTGMSGLYVGRPYPDAAMGGTVVPLVRLHPGPGRALRAVLVAGIAVEAIGQYMPARDGALALARSDGTLLAVSGHRTTEGQTAVTPLPDRPEGTVVRAGNGMPLMATSVAGWGAAQEHARRNAVHLAIEATLASIGVAVLGLVLYRRKHAAPRPAAAVDSRDEAAHAKSVFVATMSHEFRTPLHAVIGFAEVIRDQSASLSPDKTSEYAQDIATNGERLLQMVNDVLDLSRIDSGRYEIRPQVVDLVGAVEAVNRIVSPLAEERQVTLAAPAVAQDLALTADRKALMQILYNLIHNGTKFTEPSGTVSVTALMEHDGTVRLDVIDDGAGIPERDIARVMHPFEQSREILTSSNDGTGLGLALVHKLVGLHGGQVSIASTEGEGTVVSVWFP